MQSITLDVNSFCKDHNVRFETLYFPANPNVGIEVTSRHLIKTGLTLQKDDLHYELLCDPNRQKVTFQFKVYLEPMWLENAQYVDRLQQILSYLICRCCEYIKEHDELLSIFSKTTKKRLQDTLLTLDTGTIYNWHSIDRTALLKQISPAVPLRFFKEGIREKIKPAKPSAAIFAAVNFGLQTYNLHAESMQICQLRYLSDSLIETFTAINPDFDITRITQETKLVLLIRPVSSSDRKVSFTILYDEKQVNLAVGILKEMFDYIQKDEQTHMSRNWCVESVFS